MKKYLSTLLLIFMSLFIFGCQARPPKEIVTNKSEDHFENEEIEVAESEQIVSTEEKWIKELKIADIDIHINADVEVPETGVYPVVRVKQKGFDSKTVKNIVNYFAKGEKIYDNLNDDAFLTKEMAEQIIVDEKQYQTTLENVSEDNSISLQNFEKQYENLPSENEIVRTEVNIENLDMNSASVYFDTGKKIPATLSVMDEREAANRAYIQYSNYGFWGAYTNARRQEEPPKGTTISEADAIEIGKEALNEMGIDFMDVSDVQVSDRYTNFTSDFSAFDKQCYSIFFARTIDGVKNPLTQLYAWKNSEKDNGDSGNYRKPWTPEYIWMNIDDTGILSFRWHNPVEIVEVENENVPVFTLEQAKKAFEEKMKIVLANTKFLTEDSGEDQGQIVININRVVLGNQFVPVKDKMAEYRLTPCWIFLGTDTWLGEMSEEHPTCELLLDAIDGSIL